MNVISLLIIMLSIQGGVNAVDNRTTWNLNDVVLREGDSRSIRLECRRSWSIHKSYTISVSIVTSDGRDCVKGNTPSSVCVPEKGFQSSTDDMAMEDFYVTSAQNGSYTCVTKYLNVETNETTNVYVIKAAAPEPVILESDKEAPAIPCIYGPLEDSLYCDWMVSSSVKYSIRDGNLTILDTGTVANSNLSCGMVSNYYPNISTAVSANATFTTDIPVFVVAISNQLPTVGENVTVTVDGTAYAKRTYHNTTQIRWTWSKGNWASNSSKCESGFRCELTLPQGTTGVIIEVMFGEYNWTKNITVKTSAEKKPDDSNNTAVIAGSIVGGVVGVVVIILLVLLVRHRRNQPRNTDQNDGDAEQDTTKTAMLSNV